MAAAPSLARRPSMMTVLRCISDQKEGRGGTRELGWPGFALAMATATKVSGSVFLGASKGSHGRGFYGTNTGRDTQGLY
jgi:hypothetical protein